MEEKVKFEINVGGLSEKIAPKDGKTICKEESSFAKNVIPINNKFTGMVLEYQFDQSVVRGSSLKFNKQFSWDDQISKIFLLTRSQFIVTDMKTDNSGNVFIQCKDMVVQITANRSPNEPPHIKNYLHLK